ncbi:MAG: phage holin family protein [Polyangiales bacterium]
MQTDRNQLRNDDAGDLITGVIQDARELAVAEVDKIKAEIKQVGQSAKIAGVGLGFLIAATVLFGQALGFGLVALGVPAWAAFAILAVITAACGIVFVKYPRNVAKAT